MADLYVKLFFSILSSPKLVGAPAAAKWLYATGHIVSARDLTDGIIRPQVACAEAEVPASNVRTLVTRRLWHKPGHDCSSCAQPPTGQVVIHDYLEHQQSKAEVEASKAKKSRAGKKGAASRWHGGSDGARHGASHGRRHGGAVADTDAEASGGSSSSRLTVVSSSPLTDDDLDRIATQTGGGRDHAATVAADVLDRAGTEVGKPLAYVLRAIGDDPARYRAARRRTKDTCCPLPGHDSYPADNCGACRSEQLAGGA